jgi:hypothetical protein
MQDADDWKFCTSMVVSKVQAYHQQGYKIAIFS